MRNIFELTKLEQRAVILIVVALVAIAFGKHWFEAKSHPAAVRSPAAAAASPTVHPEEEEHESDDSR